MNRYTNYLAALIIMLLHTTAALAGLTFKQGVNYRIVCAQWSDGCVLPGSGNGKSTPIFHTVGSLGGDDAFWTFTKVGKDVYTIQNAKTAEYITYDGVRDTYRRYVSLTKSAVGANSQWRIVACDNGFIVTCVGNETERINVRNDGDHIVGTYSSTGSPSTNEVLNFIDADGNAVDYQDAVYADDTYGIDQFGKYWENNGIGTPVVFTTDKASPVLYTVKNVRSGKYVAINADGHLIQTDEPESEFYFVEKATGVTIYNADGTRYISGSFGYNASNNNQITTATTTTSSTTDTWSITHSTGTNAGYAIMLSKSNTVTHVGSYWNDYYSDIIGYYDLDAGGTFIFASSDKRHLKSLESAGYDFSDKVVGVLQVAQYVDTILVGSTTPVYDKRNGLYLCHAKTDYRDRRDYVVPMYMHFKDDECALYVDDELVENGADYNFGDITEGRTYNITLKIGEDVVASTPITFTFLPIVEVNGNAFSNNVYTGGTLRVNDATNDGYDVQEIAAYRFRGATAATKEKKAYAVKLRDADGESVDRAFFGLRSDNNWILDAMAIDGARMRNRVSTDLWLDFSTKPYQTQYKKKAINGTRGRFVEVIRNGSYAGIYCMTEKLDRKQLQLKKIVTKSETVPADTVHGALYKSTVWSYSVFMGHNPDVNYYPGTSASHYNNSWETWDGWEVKYPDLGDGETIDWKPLYDAINLVAAGSDKRFDESMEEYFDLPVWRDYYLFTELMLATDNHGKNEYLYNYDIRQHKKISVAPWDLDGTWGMRWDGSETITADAKQDFETFLWAHEHGENNIFRRLSSRNYKSWNESLAARYAELRREYFNPDSLTARFVNYRNLFKDSGADVREIERWNGADGISISFEREMMYLQRWIRNRVAALDKKYGYDPSVGITNVITDNFSASGGTGEIIVRSDNGSHVRIYTTDGVLLKRLTVEPGITTIPSIPRGIYIVNNNKVFVK